VDNRPFVPSTRAFLYLSAFVLIFCLSEFPATPFSLEADHLGYRPSRLQPPPTSVSSHTKSINTVATPKTMPVWNTGTPSASVCAPASSR
jgi:hypothetical protein